MMLMSRNAKHLDRYTQEFKAKRIKTNTAVMDKSDPDLMFATIGSIRER